MTKNSSGQGHGLDGFYETLRRPGIIRPRDGRWFAGVAAGVARRLGVDPLVVRAAFILFGLFFGMGIALYLVAWLLLPDEKGKLPIEAALKYGDGGSIFLLIVAGISLFGGGPWWNGNFNGFRIFGVIALVAGAWWFLTQTDAGRDLLKPRPGAGPPDPTVQQDPTAAPANAGVSTGNAAAAAGATLGASGSAPGPAPEPTSTWTPGPAPYREPRVRVRGIGFAGGLLVLGLAALSGAIVHTLATQDAWNGSPLAIAVAAGLATLGLGLVVAGLAGRSSGWLTTFAILGIVATLASLVVPRGMTWESFHVGDQSHRVTTLSQDARYELGMGNLNVDLTEADYQTTPAKPDIVHATVGLGELDLVVPQGVSVVVHAKAKAGDLTAIDANQQNQAAPGSTQFKFDGTGWDETVTYGSTSTPPDIEIFAEVGLGQIRVNTGSLS